jgi:nucleoside-diphosphate-sugar epimerase
MNFAKQAAGKLAEAQKAASLKVAQLDSEFRLSDKVAVAKASAKAKVTELDESTGFSVKAEAATFAIKARASAVDEEYHFSDKASGAKAVISAKAAAVDEKAGISAKAGLVASAFSAKALEIGNIADEKTGITRRIDSASGAIGEFTGEITKSYNAGLYLPPVPSADELQALGGAPGTAKAGPLTADAGPVCVTGSSGFIAMHLVTRLLAKGYSVHATVRSAKRSAALVALGDGYPGKLSIFEGCDLMVAGSFDVAVSGCVGVFHTASPFYPAVDKGLGVSVSGLEELVLPAVAGTRNLLSACSLAGTVQRVVVTASFACILNPDNPDFPADTTYGDGVWNVSSFPTEDNVWLQNGAGMHAYRYSKILAEKLAWDFEKSATFDVVAINPPLVVGTNLQKVETATALNESSLLVYKWLSSKLTLPPNSMAFVDVVDVANAHTLVYETPEAGGNRYLCTAPALLWSEAAATLKAACREAGRLDNANMASACATDPALKWTLDTSRIEALGMVFTPATQALQKQVASLMLQFPELSSGDSPEFLTEANAEAVASPEPAPNHQLLVSDESPTPAPNLLE